VPNPQQPRRQFDPARLEDLARSIGENGILEPLIVRPLETGGFELVAGERRLRAAQLAGCAQVPALLRDFTGRKSLEVALVENLQREDLNPVDEARAYQQLAEDFGRTHAEISAEVGKDRSTITNSLRLLKLPLEVLEMVSRGTLSAGHARVLLGLTSEADQIRMAQEMIEQGYSVREAERRVSPRDPSVAPSKPKDKTKPEHRSQEVIRVEEALQYTLGTEVRLLHTPKGGKLEIFYGSNEELERILDLIGVEVH